MPRRQTLIQLNDQLLERLDDRAARERRSRSELVREALELFLAHDREAAVDRAIVEGYTRQPPSDDAWSHASARFLARSVVWDEGAGEQQD